MCVCVNGESKKMFPSGTHSLVYSVLNRQRETRVPHEIALVRRLAFVTPTAPTSPQNTHIPDLCFNRIPSNVLEHTC